MNPNSDNKRRTLLRAATVGGLGAVLAGAAPPALAKPRVRWRMGMAWTRSAPGYTTPVVALADFLDKATGGAFQIEVFGAGDLVPAMQTFDAVLDGTLDCGHGYASYWSGKSIAMNLVMSMPFGTTAQEKNAWLQYGGGQALADKVYERLGAKFFPLGNCGVQPMGWFRREINSIDDFKGLKFRVSGLPGEVLRECGVAVVGMPLGEVLQAMQSGAVDACELTGPYIDTTLGIQRIAKNYYFPGWHEPEGQFDLFINLDAWNKLSPEYKELVRVGAYYANGVMLNELVAKNGKAFDDLRTEHGVTARLLPDDVLKRMHEITNELLAGAYERDPLARELRDSLRAFLGKAAPYSEYSELLFMQARASLAGRPRLGA
ncbi:TRAP transporter substrate-binding protein [Bordetella genomosp. 6]|uniref:TRAP transporter substrate-binding protein n=1 Tax=Bordetella genomosp. 6 TaxID=463024 RepID=UPI000A28EE87|nr:TRAP transporter substrate-binding protein [Bordetella genomosp. 6]ARP78424.1 ABC transporter substrate-binding protein [Bordetella genomosp. 6]